VLVGASDSAVSREGPCTQTTVDFLARVADRLDPAPSDTKPQGKKQGTLAPPGAGVWVHGKVRLLIGYSRVSKSDGAQVVDRQRDARCEAGGVPCRVSEELASGPKDARPGWAACLNALQPGTPCIVWRLDRLGHDLKPLGGLIETLHPQQVGLTVLAGAGTQIDPAPTHGRLVFGICAALAAFEAALMRERTQAGWRAARPRGRHGGRPRKMTVTTRKMAMTAMAESGSPAKEVAFRLGSTTSTLYAYVNGDGSLKAIGQRLLDNNKAGR
jgi:DNA invertase Pin-like site-specific DNA recombinase